MEAQDWARMTELLAPAATYDDPTVVHFGQDAIALEGREAVVEFLKKTSEEIGARNIDYDITRCFESGGITVLLRVMPDVRHHAPPKGIAPAECSAGSIREISSDQLLAHKFLEASDRSLTTPMHTDRRKWIGIMQRLSAAGDGQR